MFWVDIITEKIIKERKKKKYLVADWITPSGHIHVGSLRFIYHDIIKQALIEKGFGAKFQYGFDDYDPMDGFPPDLPQNFQKYMGMPLSNIPSPVKGYKNLAKYYAKEFEEVFTLIGVKPIIIWANELYKQGKFNKAIKIVLENAAEVRKIYFEVSKSKKDADWFPLSVICEKCGKIGTTKIFAYDSQKELVHYRCEPNMVDWAQGCGHESWISPYDGKAKMLWKAEWPSKWSIYNNDIEGEGKDHAVAGGSRDVANNIYRKIFHGLPPFDIPYEHFQVGGKKMSSSKGLGVSAKKASNILPPELLKFLIVRTRPQKAIEFDIYGDTITKLYDEYDRCIDEYLKDPQSDLARAYHFSKLSELRTPIPIYKMRFVKIAYLLQMARKSVLEFAEEEKGAKLTGEEIDELKIRENYAKIWLSKYAPDNFKFEIQEEIPKVVEKLSIEQKGFLSKIADLLDQKNWTGEELHSEIHNLKKEMNLDAKLAFSAIYLSLLGKDSGPQAGWLIVSLDKDFVIKRFLESQ